MSSTYYDMIVDIFIVDKHHNTYKIQNGRHLFHSLALETLISAEACLIQRNTYYES